MGSGGVPAVHRSKMGQAQATGKLVMDLVKAQRLPNGNTLINEGWFGRFFEVTPEGSVVWEYVNPYFGPRQRLVINSVQRAYRYSAAQIERARSAT